MAPTANAPDAADARAAGNASAAAPAALQWRVLSGLHAGAACPARDGSMAGADADCDVVLVDEGMAARAAVLRLADEGWRLELSDGQAAGEPSSSDEALLPWNRPVALGPVWVTVAPAAMPWPPAPAGAPAAGPVVPGPAASLDATDQPAPAKATGAIGAAATAGAVGGGAAGAGTAAATTAPPPPKPARPARSWPLIVGLCTVALAVLVAIVLAWLLPANPGAASERPRDPRLAAQESLGAINTALARLGLASRLQVGLTADGSMRVTGWVRDAVERDALAAALSQVWPMPAMRVSIEDDAVRTATETLRAFRYRYLVRYEGDGRLTLLGIAASARERASALDAVRAQLPGMTVMGHRIALAPDVANVLSERLAQAGLSGVSLSWTADRLQASAPDLDETSLARLQDVLARFNAEHLDVAHWQPPGGERQFADSVPFGIRSVVGGPQPFIVLDDGSKLLVGGVHRQYRLTAVEPTRLVFEGPRPAIVLR